MAQAAVTDACGQASAQRTGVHSQSSVTQWTPVHEDHKYGRLAREHIARVAADPGLCSGGTPPPEEPDCNIQKLTRKNMEGTKKEFRPPRTPGSDPFSRIQCKLRTCPQHERESPRDNPLLTNRDAHCPVGPVAMVTSGCINLLPPL